MEDKNERTLWCGNLSPEVTEDLLYELFLQAGPLEKVVIPKDPKGGGNRNFGFVTFRHAVSVRYAVTIMQGVHLFNRLLAIRARNQNQNESNFAGGGGGSSSNSSPSYFGNNSPQQQQQLLQLQQQALLQLQMEQQQQQQQQHQRNGPSSSSQPSIAGLMEMNCCSPRLMDINCSPRQFSNHCGAELIVLDSDSSSTSFRSPPSLMDVQQLYRSFSDGRSFDSPLHNNVFLAASSSPQHLMDVQRQQWNHSSPSPSSYSLSLSSSSSSSLATAMLKALEDPWKQLDGRPVVHEEPDHGRRHRFRGGDDDNDSSSSHHQRRDHHHGNHHRRQHQQRDNLSPYGDHRRRF